MSITCPADVTVNVNIGVCYTSGVAIGMSISGSGRKKA